MNGVHKTIKTDMMNAYSSIQPPQTFKQNNLFGKAPNRKQSETVFSNQDALDKQMRYTQSIMNANFSVSETMIGNSLYSSKNRKMYEVYNSKAIKQKIN